MIAKIRTYVLLTFFMLFNLSCDDDPGTTINDPSDDLFYCLSMAHFVSGTDLGIDYEDGIKWIENGLLRELSLVLGNESEKIRVSLYNDIEYLKAVEIILDNDKYKKFIMP